MVVLELFAGTRSIGKAFEARGHKVFSVEWDKKFDNIQLYADIGKLTVQDVIRLCGGVPDVIWASPDCATYSVAALARHRRKNYETGELEAVTDYAKFCDAVNKNVISLIRELNPKYYYIENPRGGMRKMTWMHGLPRYTVTYCQYGDTRMKPTDIWTNHPDPKFKPPCKNGDPCHEKAPRSSTLRKMKEQGMEICVGGTQYGMNNAKDRARIPEALCEHIVDICEEEAQEYGNMSALEKLNFYRNKYYSDGNATEAGIIANAINEILPLYHSMGRESK